MVMGNIITVLHKYFAFDIIFHRKRPPTRTVHDKLLALMQNYSHIKFTRRIAYIMFRWETCSKQGNYTAIITGQHPSLGKSKRERTTKYNEAKDNYV